MYRQCLFLLIQSTGGRSSSVALASTSGVPLVLDFFVFFFFFFFCCCWDIGSSSPSSGLKEPEEFDTGVGGASMCIAGSGGEQRSSSIFKEEDMAVQREEGEEDDKDGDCMLRDMNAHRRPC